MIACVRRVRHRLHAPLIGAALVLPAVLGAQRAKPATAPAFAVQSPASAASSAAARDSTASARATPADTSARGAPIVIFGDTVLMVPTRSGSFTPRERAAAVVSRIDRLARAPVDSLVIALGETSTDIMAGDMVLLTVTDADAKAVGISRDSLAERARAALTAALAREAHEFSARTLSLAIVWSLLSTVVLVALLLLMGRLFPRLYAALEAWRSARVPALGMKSLETLTARHLTDFLLGAARLLRLVLILLLFYIYLPLVLSFFPWTRPLSVRLVGYVTDPLLQVGRGILDFLPNVFFIVVIVVVTRYVLKVIHLVFAALGGGTLRLGSFEQEWAEPTYNIVRFLIIAFAAVVLFPYLPGAKSEAFKGVSLFLGVLISLGSSSAIANIVAGVVLTYTRAFSIGDRVQMGDTIGDVVAKTLLVTRVRTIKNVDVTIPNSMVLGAHILNYTAMASSQGLILHTSVTIGYDAPWKQVHGLLIAAAKATPGILAEPEPFVLQTSLDDFYVSYQINAYTGEPGIMASTYSLLHANIQEQFNEGGVEIMSPHYASLRDGNMTTIPADHLAKDYASPTFRVRNVDRGER